MRERHLLREPLSAVELKALARKVGGPEQLVAPRRRAEAAGLSGDALLAWLAADGARLRRPIVEVGDTVMLGFTEETRRALEELL